MQLLEKQVKISFKTCRVCRFNWSDRDQFLEDSDIELVGYQVHFRDLDKGFSIFNHSCRTSLAVAVEHFRDLYLEPIVQERKTETAECPEYCQHESELQPCPVKCECAFVRDIIQLIRKWLKKRIVER